MTLLAERIIAAARDLFEERGVDAVSTQEIADKADIARFPKINLIKIDDLGGWQAVQKKHFADGGIFDQVYGK